MPLRRALVRGEALPVVADRDPGPVLARLQGDLDGGGMSTSTILARIGTPASFSTSMK